MTSTILSPYRLFLISIMFILLACQSKKADKVNLLPYGIPYEIDAPKDVKIRKSKTGVVSNVSVSNDNNYDIQVIMEPATTNNLEKCKSIRKAEVTNDPNFIKIVEEYNDGFLIEKSNNGFDKNFDFRIIKIIGSSEVIFQTGLTKAYSEEDVKSMIKSIRTDQ